MSRALYRKYRSKSLAEVIGQRHITDILARAIASGHVSHAYLLTGPRGVGKTSVARILAHEINELKYDEENLHLDIIEIDAASNNGVEDVRDLREKVQIAPTSAKKKVYIIDEVHMLSKAAFNALLKTLEEPPEHVIFILATTNVEKLPATIISRTQRFSFRPIGTVDVVKHLKHIAKQEKIKISDEALELIAKRGEGSFRDSISLLDQISNLVSSSDTTISAELIEEALGLASHKIIDNILECLENRDTKQLVKILKQTFDEGVSPALIAKQLTSQISDLIIEKPNLLPLIDGLIEVDKSTHPQLKLLSVLGLFIAGLPEQKPIPKSAALASPAKEISVSVKKSNEGKWEIEGTKTVKNFNENTKEHDDDNHDNLETSKLADALSRASELESNEPSKTSLHHIVNNASTKNEPNPNDFDWDKFINHAKQNYVAIHSMLAKCGHQIDGETLVLYTKNKFYKNKLDEIKHSVLISKCLNEVGIFGLNIHTIPTAIPPKDDKAAAIVAIMGGGEEVALDAI